MPAFDFPSPSALSRSADGLWNYTFQLVDYLRFLFSCLDEENLSESLQRMVADTGWETPVLNSETGLTAAAGSPLRIRRVGACVFLSGAVTAPAGGLQDGSVPLFVLSKLYRPAYPVRTVCADETGGDLFAHGRDRRNRGNGTDGGSGRRTGDKRFPGLLLREPTEWFQAHRLRRSENGRQHKEKGI